MLPSCIDKSVKKTEDSFIVYKPVIRHMTPEDMDIILENTPIGYSDHLVIKGVRLKGAYVRNLKTGEDFIVLDPHFDLNEVLIHEAGHKFYGVFGTYEPNNIKWTEPMLDDVRYKKIAQKHIVRTMPDEYYWSIDDDFESKLRLNIDKLAGDYIEEI